MRHRNLLLLGLVMLAANLASAAESPMDTLEHGFADSNGVKIHYVSAGSGPLVVMVHGFPDFWYSWRKQIPALADAYRVVAIDQRGYNESDQPEGVDAYKGELLAGDVAAVIKHLGAAKATVVGHDWGGYVAWQTAARHPDLVEKLVICNLPHPKGLARELANNPDQQKNSQYAQTFKQPGMEDVILPETLAAMVSQGEPVAMAEYKKAFTRSSMAGMLNYYRANYPDQPYPTTVPEFPVLQVPVLMFHGLDDTALHASGLNNTWEWLGRDFTLVTVPGAGHWVHHDAPELVNGTLRDWLDRRR
jgi:pimeloyl-ACP methyl ester carboxylesterase